MDQVTDGQFTLGVLRVAELPGVSAKLDAELPLLWFLVRVISKPSRASYPCQRAAAPLSKLMTRLSCTRPERQLRRRPAVRQITCGASRSLSERRIRSWIDG